VKPSELLAGPPAASEPVVVYTGPKKTGAALIAAVAVDEQKQTVRPHGKKKSQVASKKPGAATEPNAEAKDTANKDAAKKDAGKEAKSEPKAKPAARHASAKPEAAPKAAEKPVAAADKPASAKPAKPKAAPNAAAKPAAKPAPKSSDAKPSDQKTAAAPRS
jgi:D-alanyl-D-alanine carboxypeptidase